jgi:hypothetical protein
MQSDTGSQTAVRAEALFVSLLQESDNPTPERVRAEVAAVLDRRSTTDIAGAVAQEAGDHPMLCQRRMSWALRAVTFAYGMPLLALCGPARVVSG